MRGVLLAIVCFGLAPAHAAPPTGSGQASGPDTAAFHAFQLGGITIFNQANRDAPGNGPRGSALLSADWLDPHGLREDYDPETDTVFSRPQYFCEGTPVRVMLHMGAPVPDSASPKQAREALAAEFSAMEFVLGERNIVGPDAAEDLGAVYQQTGELPADEDEGIPPTPLYSPIPANLDAYFNPVETLALERTPARSGPYLPRPTKQWPEEWLLDNSNQRFWVTSVRSSEILLPPGDYAIAWTEAFFCFAGGDIGWMLFGSGDGPPILDVCLSPFEVLPSSDPRCGP